MSENGQDEYLRGFWYAAMRAAELFPGEMRRCELLGMKLLVLRDNRGNTFALGDNCPHRGIPLSDGSYDGETIECCYHGWKFHGTGSCAYIPSLSEDSKVDPSRIRASSFPCREADGLLWVYVPLKKGDEPESGPPEIPRLSSTYKSEVISTYMRCGLDNGIMGLMDPAHGPFVHKAWWWRSRESIHEKSKHFEPIEHGFRMTQHRPSRNSAAYKLLSFYNEPISTTIDFVLPNRRLELVRCGDKWFSSQAVVTPVREGLTRLDFVAAWNIFHRVPLVKTVYGHFARRFMHQDRVIMERQAEGLKNDPGLILIDGADTPAKWYFQLKSAYQTSLESGQFEHPIEGPVTLKWKS